MKWVEMDGEEKQSKNEKLQSVIIEKSRYDTLNSNVLGDNDLFIILRIPKCFNP